MVFCVWLVSLTKHRVSTAFYRVANCSFCMLLMAGWYSIACEYHGFFLPGSVGRHRQLHFCAIVNCVQVNARVHISRTI